jgi:hypothetical protein
MVHFGKFLILCSMCYVHETAGMLKTGGTASCLAPPICESAMRNALSGTAQTKVYRILLVKPTDPSRFSTSVILRTGWHIQCVPAMIPLW